MNERFERYNEITFEAYCKAAIDNAVHRGVRKKERRAELEPPLTELNDAVLFRLDPTDAPQEAVLEEAITFEVCDQHITVHNAALGQALTEESVRAITPVLLRALAGKPLIFTLRTEGGPARADYAALLLAAARCGAPWIDAEALRCPDAAGLIAALHAQDCRVIASRHDFAGTPELPALLEQAEALRQSGADMIKLAVTVHEEADIAAARTLCERLREWKMDYAVIPMGEAGHKARLQARDWGCALTFGCLDCPSAPGQATLEQLLQCK